MKTDFEYIWTDKKRTLLGLPLSFTRYFLTENKFITRTGFFTITEDEFDLYRVTDKKLIMSLGQRMFGCGTVIINVRDVDTPVKEVKSIKAPRELMQMIDKQVETLRDRYNIRGRDLITGYHHDDDMDGEDNDGDE